MIKHFTILVLLVMTPIASSVTGQNLNTPKHFLMPRELSHYEQLVDQDFRMFGFITSGSIVHEQYQTSFSVTDGYKSVQAVHNSWIEEGWLKEKEPVLIEGKMKNDIFEIHTILKLNTPNVCDYLIKSIVEELNSVGFEISCLSPNS